MESFDLALAIKSGWKMLFENILLISIIRLKYRKDNSMEIWLGKHSKSTRGASMI